MYKETAAEFHFLVYLLFSVLCVCVHDFVVMHLIKRENTSFLLVCWFMIRLLVDELKNNRRPSCSAKSNKSATICYAGLVEKWTNQNYGLLWFIEIFFHYVCVAVCRAVFFFIHCSFSIILIQCMRFEMCTNMQYSKCIHTET